MGQSILESYSRVLESLAFNLLARIEDLLYVDDATKRRAMAESRSMLMRRGSMDLYNQNSLTSFSNQSSFSSSSLIGSPFRYSIPVTQRPTRLRRSVSHPASVENPTLWFPRKKKKKKRRFVKGGLVDGAANIGRVLILQVCKYLIAIAIISIAAVYSCCTRLLYFHYTTNKVLSFHSTSTSIVANLSRAFAFNLSFWRIFLSLSI